MSIELFDDDIDQWIEDLSAEPWKRISNADVRCSCRLPLRVSYEYLDMGKTQYGFDQSFTLKDTQSYFNCMKYLSGKTVDELIDNGGIQLRRHSALHKNLKENLWQLNADIVKGEPIIFHFSLYTDRMEMAARDKGIRSPRIYFMQGLYGVIYPLFFDPFHEITK